MQIFGYNAQCSGGQCLQHLIPRHKDCYDEAVDARGNLLKTYDIETYNACLLNALALPHLPRLGAQCREELRFRNNLATIDAYYEQNFYAASPTASGGVAVAETAQEAALTSDNTAHLHIPMTRTDILHFARRVGYSIRSIDPDLVSGASSQLTLNEAISQLLSSESIARGTAREL